MAPGDRFLSNRVRVCCASLVPMLVCLSCLAGCTTSLRQWWHNGWKVGPNYCRPVAPVAQDWIDSSEPQLDTQRSDDCAWWAQLADPTLDSLVAQAYEQNLDLRAAGTRILTARAQRNIAVGNLLPQQQRALSLYSHGQMGQNLGLPLPPTFNIWATGFNASWELDFWGRYRRTIEAAGAELDAAVEAYRAALVLLVGEVATNYVQMRTFEQRLAFARQNVAIQQGSLKLAEDRFRDGVASELDVHQARSNLLQTEARIPPLEIGRRQAANRLCVLLGLPPYQLADSLPKAGIPHAPISLAVGIPADLLRRRPDVRQAESLAAAQSARIGVAESDLYPRFSVTGFIGYAADDLKHLFDAKSFTGFVTPTMSWNILNYGRILNNVRSQDAQLQTAVLQYQQTVLTAGREVEDALVAFIESERQAALVSQSVEEARRSVELVTIQYKGGIVDFNRVYTTQELLVTQQDQLAEVRGNIALAVVRLYQALGGGWQHFMACSGCPPIEYSNPLPAAETGEEVLPGKASEQPPAATKRDEVAAGEPAGIAQRPAGAAAFSATERTIVKTSGTSRTPTTAKNEKPSK